MIKGQVIKLDRGFPLVKTEDGNEYRCEHAMALIKGKDLRSVIGDYVLVDFPQGHDKAIIEEILPRTNVFIRKDPTEQALPQVLAANFDQVFVTQSLVDLNLRRLERELVLAHEAGAEVSVILSKADLAEDSAQIQQILKKAQALVGQDRIMLVSTKDAESIEQVRAMVKPGSTAVLIGKSGVGKSSLVNMLLGSDMQETSEVREADGKGRHTTVSREMIDIPGGGRIVDMPGVRGLGLWDAEVGIEAAFADIEKIAAHCKFGDCKHENEPGCAVQEAITEGTLTQPRMDSYKSLKREVEEIQGRREEATRMRTRIGHPRKHTTRKKK